MDDELNSSVLGTLEYWNNAYQTELQNFTDHGDTGVVWFGESISRKIVKWICENPRIKKTDKILDIGCGNGMLLIELCKKGYTTLRGIDYSKNAIDLAMGVSKKENCDIKFSTGDILEDAFSPNFHVALDKGTYDAISLDPEDAVGKRKKYIENLRKLLLENGIFLITSCNWTENELKQQFNTYFDYVESLPTPSFTFGGQSGSTVTSVVFKKQ